MNRDYDESMLLGYVEDELSADQRVKVEQWMADDPRLAALLRGMADDRAAMRELPEPTPPDWVIDDVDRGLERTMLLDSPVTEINGDDPEQRHTVRRVAFGLVAAASVLLAAGVVIWSVTGPNIEPVTLDREVAMDDPAAPPESPEPAADADHLDALNGVTMKGDGGTGDIDSSGRGTAAEDPAPTGAAGQAAEFASKQRRANGSIESFEVADAALAEPALAEPADAGVSTDDKLVVVMQTRDVARSVRQINFVIDNITEAQVEPLDETSNEILLRDRRVGGVGGMKVAPAAEAEAEAEAESDVEGQVSADAGAGADAPAGKAGEARAELAQQAPAEPAQDDSDDRRQQAQRLGRDMNELTAAQVESPTATAVPGRQRYAYNLFVPADQVDKAVELLKKDGKRGVDGAEEVVSTFQRVELNRGLPEAYREQVGWRFDDAEPDADAYANARRNWPRRAPDYGDILRQQLPLETREVAEQRRRPDQIMIPVIIETQTADPAN